MDQQPDQPPPQPPPQPPDPTQPAQQRSAWAQQVVGHMLDNLKSNYEDPHALAAQDHAYWSKAIKPTRGGHVLPQLNADGSLKLNADGSIAWAGE